MTAFLRILSVLGMLVALWGGPVFAQDSSAPVYDDWRRVAVRAAEAIENDRASESAMSALRDQLVVWRAQFNSESSQKRVSVQTLQAQLTRLGPAPESGEAPDAAETRHALEMDLFQAQAPARRADLALTEADELIRAIDTLLRDRQTQILLEAGPIPIWPSLWSQAAAEVSKTARLIGLEFVTGWEHEKQRKELNKALPLMMILVAIGLALVARGHSWTEHGLARLVHGRTKLSASRWVAGFLISFGQVLLPLLGVYLLTKAVYVTDLPGLRGDVVLAVMPLLTFELLVSKWLGARIFSQHHNPLLLVHLTEREKRQGRNYSTFLGVALAANTLFDVLARYDTWTIGTQAVVFFFVTLMAAVFLARLGMLVGRHSQHVTSKVEGEPAPLAQLIFVISRFMIGAGALSVLLGLAGLTRAGGFLIISSAKTVLLIAFLLVAQRLIQKIFAAIAGADDDDSSLAAVLVGALMMVASLPLLALTWGARSSDLSEMWDRIVTGLQVGDMTLSPRTIVIFLIVYSLGHGITRLLQSMMRDNILPKTKIDPGGQTAIVAGAGYIGIFLAALVSLNVAGIDLGNIALFAGALSVGIGFGLQTIVSNFVSGIILLIERPIAEGDWIEVGGNMGYVRDISVRATRIETFDRSDVVVPNSDLISGTVTNYTRGNTVGRVIISVGVAYGTDTRRVESILREIAEAHPMVLANPGPSIVFQGFGADALDFEIRAILRDVNWMLTVKSDINHEIARRFVQEQIEIPFAQRDIWLRNPEALRQPTASGPKDIVAEAAPIQTAADSTPPDLKDLSNTHETDAPDSDGAGGEGDGR